MPSHTTHLTSEALPEPGELRRVVSVHPGNRTYETIPVGHEPGWLVADPNGTNAVYWTDDEVSSVSADGRYVANGHGVPAFVLSRHGARREPAPSEPAPSEVASSSRRRRQAVQTAAPTDTEVADKLAEALGDDEP